MVRKCKRSSLTENPWPWRSLESLGFSRFRVSGGMKENLEVEPKRDGLMARIVAVAAAAAVCAVAVAAADLLLVSGPS